MPGAPGASASLAPLSTTASLPASLSDFNQHSFLPAAAGLHAAFFSHVFPEVLHLPTMSLVISPEVLHLLTMTVLEILDAHYQQSM